MTLVDDISTLRGIGWSWTRIAAHYGVSEREVRRWTQPDEPVPEYIPPPLAVRYKPVFIVNDLQYPATDMALWDTSIQIARDAEAEELIWAGDILDFQQMSNYSDAALRAQTAEEDVAEFHRLVREPMIKSVPSIQKEIWLHGNHEERYERFMKHTAKALALPNSREFMGLQDMDEIIEYGSRLAYFLVKDELCVTHGWLTGRDAGRKHVRAMGCSVIHGHTHRVSAAYETTGSRLLVGYEVGHMTDYRKVPGVHGKGKPDWQQVAGTIVYVARKGESFDIHPLVVFGKQEDRVIANGKEYHIER